MDHDQLQEFLDACRPGSDDLQRPEMEPLRRLIETEALKPGVKLPASRELAADLGVDRTTIVSAYDQLVAQGLATAHVGQGTFVAAHVPGNVALNVRRARPAAARHAPTRVATASAWPGFLRCSADVAARAPA